MTVEQKQCLLAYYGYYPASDIDGIWGNQSAAATEAFQAANGLTTDGIFGAQTEAKILAVIGSGAGQASASGSGSGDWWDSIEHFTREEVACKCGGKYCNGYPADVSEKLMRAAEKVRNHFGATVIVSSGLRCEQHNANVGGVSDSRHKNGKALDFCVSGFSAASVLDYVQHLSGIRYAYAIDSQFVHMDVQ